MALHLEAIMTNAQPPISKPDASYWRNVPASEATRRVALDHSLAFHRLQEARQELHQARTKSSTLSPREQARLIAHCEANLALAEQWLARTSEIQAKVSSEVPEASAYPGAAIEQSAVQHNRVPPV
jgi:capsule polysaccharide export protein KpsE/RkpR